MYQEDATLGDIGFGVILINMGTPTAPTPRAVRRYLAQFLTDRRVVDLPPALWWPLLYGIILNTRPRVSARLYRKIWSEGGAPLLKISQRLAGVLEDALRAECGRRCHVRLGMRYGEPSVPRAIEQARDLGCERLLILPLYPQYSTATTASAFDEVERAMRRPGGRMPLRLVTHYHDEPAYIEALAERAREVWAREGPPEHLLISLHGLPVRLIEAGDPYRDHCEQTARWLAGALALNRSQWTLCYQSKFGPGRWLGPSTERELQRLGKKGVRSLDVICPGFATDGLETMEEINHTGREIFRRAGGGRFRYIPALNERPGHVRALKRIVLNNLAGWVDIDGRR